MRVEARDARGKTEMFECGDGLTDVEIIRRHGLHNGYTVTVWPNGKPEEARIIQQGDYHYA